MAIRIATFNVENLFGRAKVLNFKDHNQGDRNLDAIGRLNALLEKAAYTADDKREILRLYRQLKSYIEVREDRGKLFRKRGWSVTGVAADGAGEWDGAIVFKQARFSEVARDNTAQVIKDVRADIACIVEVENRQVLNAFDAHLMGSRYRYEMLIDANDPRGIDVALYSKFPFGVIRTHMFEKEGRKIIFSRDCLEVEVQLSDDRSLYVLCNHFKSRGYDYDGTADAKRKRQAKRVAEILGRYDLANDLVVVAGDLNDNPTSAALRPLLSVPGLHDVLERKFPDDTAKRWTYHYDRFEQIDYLLASTALMDQFHDAGVERRGMYNLERLTRDSNGQVETEEEYDSVTHWSNAASDHGAVWAEFTVE